MFSFLFALAITAQSSETLQPEDFAYGILLEQQKDTPVSEFDLTAVVYEQIVRDDLGDIRVFNTNEEIVPHALRRITGVSISESKVPVPIFPLLSSGKTDRTDGENKLTTAPDGSVIVIKEYAERIEMQDAVVGQYIVDLSSVKTKITALEFELNNTSENYVKKFTVEQSRDLSQWRRLGSSATVTNLHYGEHDLSDRRYTLPARHEPYLRLKWQGNADHIQLTGVNAIIEDREQTQKLHRQSRIGVQTGTAPLTFEFNTGGPFLIRKVSIHLTEQNSFIEAQLSSRATEKDVWRHRYQGIFYNLRLEGHHVVNDLIDVPPLQDQFWQLRVLSENGLGSLSPRFDFSWASHKLLFLARGNGPFLLAYGSGKADAPSSADQAFSGLLKQNKRDLISTARFDGKLELSGEEARDKKFDISFQRIALWLILGGGVCILGFMAFRLARQMSET